MSSNLVPKVITDKNGVVTTRMVKQDADVRRSSIPQVISNKGPLSSRSDNYTYAAAKLSKVSEYELNVREMIRSLQWKDDWTLDWVARSLKDASEDRTVHIAGWVDNMEEKQLRETLAFLDAFDDEADPGFIEETVAFLHYYDELPEDDLSSATPEQKELVRGFISVADAVYRDRYDRGEPDCTPRLERDLCELVADRKDELPRIIEIIKTRKVDTAVRIKVFLDTDSPQAVAEGVL